MKATFDVRELTYFLDGGEKFTKIREKFMMELERDPTFRMHDMYDVTKDQIRQRTMEKVYFHCFVDFCWLCWLCFASFALLCFAGFGFVGAKEEPQPFFF